jgi:hypothetical protein
VESIKLLLNLEHLETSYPSPYELLDHTFPHLVSLRIRDYVQHSQAAAFFSSFFTRHPKLASVSLPTISPTFQVPPSRIPLPNLRHFSGPVEFIPSLNTSVMEEIRLDWSHSHVDPLAVERIAVALKSMTRDIPLVVCYSANVPEGHAVQILDSLSRHVPRMKTFHHECLQSEVRLSLLPGSILIFAQFMAYLPRLEGLRYLSIYDPSDSSSDVGSERAIVQSFAEICPMLEVCQLGEGFLRFGHCHTCLTL